MSLLSFLKAWRRHLTLPPGDLLRDVLDPGQITRRGDA